MTEGKQAYDIRQTLKQAQSIPPMPPLDQLESLMNNDATLSLVNLTDDMLLPDIDSLLKPYTTSDGMQDSGDGNLMGLPSFPNSPIPASPTVNYTPVMYPTIPATNTLKGVYVEDGKKYKLQSGKKILVCMEENCKTRASYGHPGATVPVSCKKHADPGMSDIKNKKCEFEGCNKLPSFCFPGKAVTHCKEHAVPGMNVHRCKLCEHQGCLSRSYFNYPGMKSRFCRVHALPGMVIQKSRKCEEPTCNARPSYGYPGSKPARCAEHKVPGMVNTRHPRCSEVGCSKWPCYALPGKTVKYCKEHAKEGMVDVQNRRCEEDGCSVRAFWGLPGEAPSRCKDHILEGMLYKGGACKQVGCKKAPKFGQQSGRAEYCAEHKQPGMVDLKAKTCAEEGCSKSPGFNYWNKEEPMYCRSHAKEAMVSIVAKVCERENCRKRAYYAIPGEMARWCKQHKEPGAELKSKKVCASSECRETPLFNLQGEKPKWCMHHKTPEMKYTVGTVCSHLECSKSPTHGKLGGVPECCKKHASRSMVDLKDNNEQHTDVHSADFNQIILHNALASQLKAGPIPIAPKPIAPKPQLIAPAVSQVVTAAAQLLMPKTDVGTPLLCPDPNEAKFPISSSPLISNPQLFQTTPPGLVTSPSSQQPPQKDDSFEVKSPGKKRKHEASISNDEKDIIKKSDNETDSGAEPDDDIDALFSNVGYPVPKSYLADFTKKLQKTPKSPSSEDNFPAHSAAMSLPGTNFLPMHFSNLYAAATQPTPFNPFFPMFNPYAFAPEIGSPQTPNSFTPQSPCINATESNDSTGQKEDSTAPEKSKPDKPVPTDMKAFLDENGLSTVSDLLCQAFESDMSVLIFSAQDDKVQFDKDLQSLGMSLYQRRKLNMSMKDFL